MGLFDKVNKVEPGVGVVDTNEYVYSVQEAQEKLFSLLHKSTGWRFLKSSKILKNSIGNLAFEIHFRSSKWNQSHQIIDIQACFYLVYKKYGKLAVDNTVASVMYEPEAARSDNPNWYDISTERKLNATYEELNTKIQNTAVRLYQQYEKDIVSATRDLFENHFEEYRVHLDFVADILGRDIIMPKAKEIYEMLSDSWKQQVVDYKNGARNKAWMINRNNLKFIVDNELIEI